MNPIVKALAYYAGLPAAVGAATYKASEPARPKHLRSSLEDYKQLRDTLGVTGGALGGLTAARALRGSSLGVQGIGALLGITGGALLGSATLTPRIMGGRRESDMFRRSFPGGVNPAVGFPMMRQPSRLMERPSAQEAVQYTRQPDESMFYGVPGVEVGR
jgi:hypothetical protein